MRAKSMRARFWVEVIFAALVSRLALMLLTLGDARVDRGVDRQGSRRR